MLTRYWYEFEKSEVSKLALSYGVGVTAHTREDAENLMKERIFNGILPTVINVVENIKFSDLEQKHVIHGVGVMPLRGIWFPCGLAEMYRP